MTEDTHEIDLLTNPGRVLSVLGGAGGVPTRGKVLGKIRFTWPLFRRFRTEADTFEDISVPGGTLKGPTAGTLNRVVRDSTTWLTQDDIINEFFWVRASAVAIVGNAVADITPVVVAGMEPRVYRLEQMLQTLVNGAAVANRVPNIQLLTGMRPLLAVPIPVNAAQDWQVAGAVVTANQDASIFVPPSPGAVCVNTNGVMTFQLVSPLPMYVTTDVQIRSIITLGAVADLHNIIALMRRVA